MSKTLATFVRRVRRFFTSNEGPTAVEYALLIALIGLICATSIQSLGKNANKTFRSASKTLGS